ncbi:MAG TPA: sigma-70 family RNA polymerase sigma factor [Bryobacteraceae bacterium]|nr:sigma-70 family RNA polymerase sigma factor [Bryobacteraceae bacterium]
MRTAGALLKKIPLETEQAAESYLKALAANAVRDSLRAESAQRRDRGHTQRLDELIGEVHQTSERSKAEQQIVLTELDAALDATPKERTIFWLYYRAGLTAKEIASLPSIGLTPKGVESLVYRLTRALRESIRKSPATEVATKLKGKTVPEAF